MHPDYLAACSNEWLKLRRKRIFAGLLLASSGLSTAMAVGLAVPLGGPGHIQAPGESAVAAAMAVSLPVATANPRRASFERVQASVVAHQVADWVLDSGDNGSLPFMIVDKKDAKVFAFYADGRLRGAAFALLGLALGDDSVPGIGKRSLASILPEERTTPAGRFVASLGRNLQGNEILWVDYDAAISLHAVITGNPEEHRAQRLATPSPLDNRISYGCINVPADFFKDVVLPTFKGTNGIVYVLPETRSTQAVFGLYDVDERARLLRSNSR
jgi:hypothetical protein